MHTAQITQITKQSLGGLFKKALGLSAIALGLNCSVVSAQILTTVAGSGASTYSGDGGAATAAGMVRPNGVAIDASGNMYIADATDYRIRRVTPAGVISTYAGTGVSGTTGDGAAATAARLNTPWALATDAAGNLYIAEAYSYRIRKVSTSGIITRFAGTGTNGYLGDGGAATNARIDNVTNIAADAAGNIYLGDAGNHVIRKINTSGIISTVAGNNAAGYSGDGGAATNAKLNSPQGIAFDVAGNMYIADHDNHRIRKVSTAGIITTFAGIGTLGFSGDGAAATAAKLKTPSDVATDRSGNVYIADDGNYRIRKVNSSGIITTLTGNGSAGYTGDGGRSNYGKIGVVQCITTDAAGSVYIADGLSNHVVRRIAPAISYLNGATSQNFGTCNSAVNISLFNFTKVVYPIAGRTITWSIGSAASHGTASGTYSTTSTGSTLTPYGIAYTPTAGYSGSDAFTVQVTDGIDTANLAFNVTVYALPSAPTISGASNICVGGSSTLTGIPSGGTWSSNNSPLFTFTSGGVVTGLIGGNTGTMVYTISDGRCTNKATYPITVSTTTDIAALVGGVWSVCPGATFTMTHPTAGGTWASTNNSIATVSGGVVTGVRSGRDTIVYTITNACGAISTRWPFSVTGPTLPASITGSGGILCMGTTAHCSDATAGGTWSSTDPSVATISSTGDITPVSAGTDTIKYTITGACGLTGSAVRTLTVLALPNPGVISGPSTVAIGAYINLTTSGATGGQWTSSTPSLAVVNTSGRVRGVAVGTDTIKYAVYHTCGIFSTTKVITITSSREAGNNGSVITGDETGSIKLFPNPTSGVIKLEITGPAANSSIVITDISGKILMNRTTEDKTMEFDMSYAPAGVYLVTVNSNGKEYTERIVIQ